jgi:hypothetical protein
VDGDTVSRSGELQGNAPAQAPAGSCHKNAGWLRHEPIIQEPRESREDKNIAN